MGGKTVAAWLALLTKLFFPFHSAFHPFPTAEPAGPLNRLGHFK